MMQRAYAFGFVVPVIAMYAVATIAPFAMTGFAAIPNFVPLMANLTLANCCAMMMWIISYSCNGTMANPPIGQWTDRAIGAIIGVALIASLSWAAGWIN